MQKFFKLKFVLLLLASSFVLARGLVCVKNVNSSYAMQSRVDFEK